MSVSLSIKNVPDELAARLRARAARNRRSLQRELMVILEAAVARNAAPHGAAPREAGAEGPRLLSIEEVFERARVLFPRGTSSSVELIRAMRDGRGRELLRRVRSADRKRPR